MPEPFFFDPEELQEVGRQHREGFQGAKPFPHIVLDDLVPPDVLRRVVDEVPSPEEWRRHPEWTNRNKSYTVKLAVSKDSVLGPETRELLYQFNSSAFLDFLETLTGIEGLIADPHYFGGGVHQIEPGGFLKIHADYNIHPRLHLDRRLNALLYLNENWKDEWGGHIELWDESMSQAVQKIAPVFNRLVIFTTTDTSYHGHPEPLACPPGVQRRSLALYYYSNGRPEEEQSEAHSTLYQVRPDEDFDPKGKTGPVTWKDFVPPVAARIRHKVKRP